MIEVKNWVAIPSQPVLKVLPEIKWQSRDDRSAAVGTASLMIYVALCFMAKEQGNDGEKLFFATSTYDSLGEVTGISRALIAKSLIYLNELNLIQSEGSRQDRRYQIIWQEPRWFKLPCKAIVRNGVIFPFQNFLLRSKQELYAMKLYLYLAGVRSNDVSYSKASYEKIMERTGISERDIRKSIIVLTTCGLLANVDRELSVDDEGDKIYGPNKYFLSGYKDLRNRDRAVSASSPTLTEAAASSPVS